MSSLFDFEVKTDDYAVMGNPISHSKSPFIHACFAKQTGQRIRYTAIQVDPGGFSQAVGNFVASGGKGLNITVPFKRDAWELADERSARAELAGAVNTILIRPNHTLFGDNTDGIGLLNDITHNHAGNIENRRILLLGAGGAVRGVLSPLLDGHPAELVIANRTADKAIELACEFAHLGPVSGCGFPELSGKSFDLIINGTAASMQGEQLPLPETVVTPQTWCYDMMYGKEPTVFMHWCARRDAAKILDGLGMLVEQAAEAFYVWRGVRPDTQSVIEMLRKSL
jgi:shikimate dehydrogenase